MKTCNELIEKRKRIWKQFEDIEEDKQYNQYVCALWRNELKYRGNFIGEHITKEIGERPYLLIELFFRVTNKDFKQVPFFLNEVQKNFQKQLDEMYLKQKYNEVEAIKFIILKGRQQGFTTYITAFQECLMMVEHGFRGFTMAHDTDSTKSIFDDIAKNFYENLIDEVKENPKRSNAKELVLEGNDSAWRIATAGSKGAGRGKKLRMLHSSEKAFWDDLETNRASIGQALANRSIEIVETTANGFNSFKDIWDEAINGNSVYIPVFYEWYNTNEYRKGFNGVSYTINEFIHAVDNGERFKGVDSKFMRYLKEAQENFELDIEQLHWYFAKRQELKDKVFQEYPCTAEQAFLHSGTPYFDIELLDMQIAKLKDYEPLELFKGGDIEVYKQPVPNKRYCIGADVSEGLEDRDSSTFAILDLDTFEVVVEGEYIEKPEIHARILHEWSLKYNKAFIAVERNNHGHSTLNTLDNDLNYRRHLYIEKTVDKLYDKTVEKLGWSTNSKSKYIMLDKLDRHHREEKIKINSVKTLKQMRSAQTENGKIETNGKDRLIAVAIALVVSEEALNRSRSVGKIKFGGF